jgi:hypothetical protein
MLGKKRKKDVQSTSASEIEAETTLGAQLQFLTDDDVRHNYTSSSDASVC